MMSRNAGKPAGMSRGLTGKSAGKVGRSSSARSAKTTASKQTKKTKSAVARNGDRPVGGGMYEKKGTGTTPNGDRPVGGGMYEKKGTGTEHVEKKHRDDIVVVPLTPGEVTVSYGSTPGTAVVRVDDLRQNKKKVQSNCDLLQAKVNKLMADLARYERALAALQGVQNVDYSDKNKGTSTSFIPPGNAQSAIDSIQFWIGQTTELLARYQADLARCLAAQG